MPHSPQHCQAYQLVEPITGINKCCPAQICILSEEFEGSQFPLSPITVFLTLDINLTCLLNTHLQCFIGALCRLLLCPRCLYS